MATLVDSSVWIDFTRARSSQHLKQFIAPYILAPGVALAEPVAFEVLRYANELEAGHLREQFRLLPLLPTPYDIWDRAAILGQNCREQGINAGAMDLLISIVAMDHAAELVTFDADFLQIAQASDLRVNLLVRPVT